MFLYVRKMSQSLVITTVRTTCLHQRQYCNLKLDLRSMERRSLKQKHCPSFFEKCFIFHVYECYIVVGYSITKVLYILYYRMTDDAESLRKFQNSLDGTRIKFIFYKMYQQCPRGMPAAKKDSYILLQKSRSIPWNQKNQQNYFFYKGDPPKM